VDFRDQIKKLTSIGAALTSEHDLNRLLRLIVGEARALTNADGGSLYTKDGDHLHFVVSQNETLEARARALNEQPQPFKPFPVRLTRASIAGYVALTAETVNLPDVRRIPPGQTYAWSPAFDEQNDYLTRSMLSVPILDQQDQVIGVLQLINARPWSDPGRESEPAPFDELQEEMVRSLASQAGVAISNARLTARIKAAYLDTIYRLSVAAEYKDHDTAAHIKRMSLYSKIIAARRGLSEREVELVLYASPMHDVGKLGVPDAILLKPGPLDPDERKIMRNHTIYGAKILEGSDAEVLEWSRVIALAHHEKWDGTGYPYNLRGEAIPLTGRMVALADVFDALTSRRPYKQAWTFERAIQEIQKGSGAHFDPAVVECFMTGIDDVRQIYDEFQELERFCD
jgi:putative two-component system response regulator